MGGGDLDNRLKILFDGLRVPHEPTEVPKSSDGEKGKRIYCLLDDDALITRFTVRTYELLSDAGGVRGADVELLIHVTVRPTRSIIANIGISR